MGIVPIPTTRVGDYFIRQRLTGQVQSDQLALFHLQNQISTGQRLLLPSNDAPAALRGINLQRLLDRKDQIRTNVQSSKFFLNTAWENLGHVSSQISEVRGAALEVVGTVATENQRQAVIQTIDEALKSLEATANSKALGRYLFSGSRSQLQPYDYNGQYVEYDGNEGLLRSYVDLEQLFETNVSGQDVFGGVSAAIQSSVDLNPQLTSDTQLSTLNGGSGISRNPAVTISITTGGVTKTSLVDLSGAVTIGDVARLIETNAPSGTTVMAEVTGTGLTLRTASGSTITVNEVAEGRTARELGLYSTPGGPVSNTLTGSDLDPVVLKTTPLSNLLGTKAQGRLISVDPNNDLLLTASSNGTEYNGVTVQFVTGGTAGSELATYNSGTNTLTV